MSTNKEPVCAVPGYEIVPAEEKDRAEILALYDAQKG